MRGLALGLLLAAMACTPVTGSSGTAPLPPGVPANEIPAGVPANAIPAGDGLYMVPAGLLDGCPSFRPIAPGQAVAAVIHFRKTGGGFTTSRAEADCRAG